MVLDIEGLLGTIKFNSSSSILEQIKAGLKEQNEKVYQEWEKEDFSKDYLFEIVHEKNLSGIAVQERKTLLHIAIQKHRKDIAQYLIENGADTNVPTMSDNKTFSGYTPLHFAAAQGDKDIVQYLVEKGADIEARNGISFTPLHYAAFQGKTTVFAYLIGQGADVSARTTSGKTVKDLARHHNEIKTVAWKAGRSFTGLCMAIGLFLGLSTAYLTGSTTLTPVGTVVGVFLAAAAVGTLVGYGFAKVSRKFSIESAIQHYNQPSVV
ncbi:MAG: ankyrin repeat domain-containing protein [Wolbachia sp.]